MANAILMASGLGTRMLPLTKKTPKPLIKVYNKTMIETIIEALMQIKIDNIFIVVGYLSEQFNYLLEKYPNIEIINNPDYETVNNISSIYYASEKLLLNDCFICEADLYISDKNIMNICPQHSGYFGKMVMGNSDDWVFDIADDGYITRIGKVGYDKYNMVGLSYFTAADAIKLAHAIKKAYGTEGYETLFWDDVVNRNLDSLKLKVFPVQNNQIVEIDTVSELEAIEKEISNGNRNIC